MVDKKDVFKMCYERLLKHRLDNELFVLADEETMVLKLEVE
jgi:hypothetical protein